MQDELEVLNELILTFKHQIEIVKKPSEYKTLISLFKPNNLSELDNEKISNMNINQQTLFNLVSFEQTTFDENNIKKTFEPNNICKFVMRNYKIRIYKNQYENNICAKIYNENEMLDEIFSNDIQTLIKELEFYCAQHLNILEEDYILN